MYELWARRRKIEGKGFPYEFIFSFDNPNYSYTAIDTLDKNVYQECMVTNNGDCLIYTEFEKPMIKQKFRRNK